MREIWVKVKNLNENDVLVFHRQLKFYLQELGHADKASVFKDLNYKIVKDRVVQNYSTFAEISRFVENNEIHEIRWYTL